MHHIHMERGATSIWCTNLLIWGIDRLRGAGWWHFVKLEEHGHCILCILIDAWNTPQGINRMIPPPCWWFQMDAEVTDVPRSDGLGVAADIELPPSIDPLSWVFGLGHLLLWICGSVMNCEKVPTIGITSELQRTT